MCSFEQCISVLSSKLICFLNYSSVCRLIYLSANSNPVFSWIPLCTVPDEPFPRYYIVFISLICTKHKWLLLSSTSILLLLLRIFSFSFSFCSFSFWYYSRCFSYCTVIYFFVNGILNPSLSVSSSNLLNRFWHSSIWAFSSITSFSTLMWL